LIFAAFPLSTQYPGVTAKSGFIMNFVIFNIAVTE
jgi:hypothetical protein